MSIPRQGIAALLLCLAPFAQSVAGEEIRPLRAGSVSEMSARNDVAPMQRWTSANAEAVARLPVNSVEIPQKSVVRLSLPPEKAGTGARLRVVDITSDSFDGSLNFSSVQPPAPAPETGIPGLVSPEILALDQYTLKDPEPRNPAPLPGVIGGEAPPPGSLTGDKSVFSVVDYLNAADSELVTPKLNYNDKPPATSTARIKIPPVSSPEAWVQTDAAKNYALQPIENEAYPPSENLAVTVANPRIANEKAELASVKAQIDSAISSLQQPEPVQTFDFGGGSGHAATTVAATDSTPMEYGNVAAAASPDYFAPAQRLSGASGGLYEYSESVEASSPIPYKADIREPNPVPAMGGVPRLSVDEIKAAEGSGVVTPDEFGLMPLKNLKNVSGQRAMPAKR